MMSSLDNLTTAALHRLITYIGPALLLLAISSALPHLWRRWRFVRTLDRIPGPRSFPIIGSAWILFGVPHDRLQQRISDVMRQYPSLMRTWQGSVGKVMLRRAEHVELVLGNRHANTEKNWEYDTLHPWMGHGLFTSPVTPKWRAHKRLIMPALNFSMLEGFCGIFAEQSAVLVQKLEALADTGQAVAVFPLLELATLDMIAEAAMGLRMGMQRRTERHEYSHALHRTMMLAVERSWTPWYRWDWAFALTADGREFRECVRVMHEFTDEVIRKRKAERAVEQQKLAKNGDIKQTHGPSINTADDDSPLPKRRAFLDVLLDVEHDGQLSAVEIREEVDTVLFAGHDTTTVSMSWTIWLLANNPTVQERLFGEVSEVFANGDPQRAATMADVSEMKYLERVIKESLRLYPSAPIVGRRVSEAIHMDGYEVPVGTQVMLNFVELHRDERYFPDPERFDPDRFLPENMEGRHPYAYVPFSAGIRTCVGKKFAQAEEMVVLSTLVRNFRFRVREDERVEDERMLLELTAKPSRGVPVMIERRV